MTKEELLERIGALEAEADDLKDHIKELLEEGEEMQEIIDTQKKEIEEYKDALSDIQSITKKLV